MGELDDGYAGLELFDHKGMAQIVHFGTNNTRNAEVAIDSRADVADQEGIAGLGDEEGGIFGFGALFDVSLDGELGGVVEGDAAGVVRLISTDFEVRFLKRNVLELESSEFADAQTSLEQELDDPIHPHVIFYTVA